MVMDLEEIQVKSDHGPVSQQCSDVQFTTKCKIKVAAGITNTWFTEGNPDDYDIDKVLQDLVSTLRSA